VRDGQWEMHAVTRAQSRPIARRRLMLLLAASMSPLGCASAQEPRGKKSSRGSGCTSSDDGGAGTYCLVEPRLLRVPNARALGVGQALLANIDDNTAVIVARDPGGFHALSAICTHACCLVSLCRASDCSTVTSNPGECRVTEAVSIDENAAAVACPCHGSSFRVVDGAPTGGPARRPLPSYAIQFDGQDALVDTGRIVEAAARV
jgi:nitrite reductase/ring-hydroxylating ferredoxin subunit